MTSEISETEVPEAEAPEAELPEADLPEAASPEEDASEEGASEEGASEEDEDESDADEGDAAAADDADDMEASDFDNLRLVEALLFASAEPLAPAQLARFLPEDCKLEPLLTDLQTLYANRGVNLVKRGGRWAFRTAEDLASRMELENKVVRKLSRVALETLAVIAYHQPVTRAEIEEIRGVALSKGTLDALLEIGWIRPKGRRKTPGRPVTWGTSDSFLDHFGLEGLDALPGVEELKAAGLLDTRPALTALSDRGLLPAAGEVSAERVDDEDDESEDDETSDQELLEETFGEDLLPHEVNLATAGGPAGPDAEDDPADAQAEEAADEAENEMFGGADDAGDDGDDSDAETEEGGLEAEDDLDLAAAGDDEGEDDYDDLDDDEDADSEDDDVGPSRRRHAG